MARCTFPTKTQTEQTREVARDLLRSSPMEASKVILRFICLAILSLFLSFRVVQDKQYNFYCPHARMIAPSISNNLLPCASPTKASLTISGSLTITFLQLLADLACFLSIFIKLILNIRREFSLAVARGSHFEAARISKRPTTWYGTMAL